MKSLIDKPNAEKQQRTVISPTPLFITCVLMLCSLNANANLDTNKRTIETNATNQGYSGHPNPPQWTEWQAVGNAKLTWGFWTIYDSQLRTPSGGYQADQPPLALVIHYHRNIKEQDLLNATDEQWEHLGFDASTRQQWLAQLEEIWPSVQKGDTLTFVLTANDATFYFNNQAIGTLHNRALSFAFINIWLSPNTAYPMLRNDLIGKS